MELLVTKNELKTDDEIHAYNVRISHFQEDVIKVIMFVIVNGGKVFYSTPSGGRVAIVV